MVDPNGLVTTNDYNNKGLLVTQTETPPTGNVRITTILYNAQGLPRQSTTPDGITRIFEYDTLNRPTRVENQLGEAHTTSYDNYGNPIQISVLNIDGTTCHARNKDLR